MAEDEVDFEVADRVVRRSPHRVCEEGCKCAVVYGCPCGMCYTNGEDEEIFDTDDDDEYAFMNSFMRIKPGCHRRSVWCPR